MRKQKTSRRKEKMEGIISISAKGTGYVKVEEQKKDIEIDFRHLNTAMHRDVVEVIPHVKMNGKVTGEISKILLRAKTNFTGILEKDFVNGENIFFFKPDDPKMYTDILIPKKLIGSAKPNQKVFVEMEPWRDSRKMPTGKVIKVLGKPGDNNTEMLSIALEKGFDEKFPNKVEHAATEIGKQGIKKEDYNGRRDFTKILTFTIDPEDAKDFDDAISFKPIDNNEYEIGIHIADVSNYVKTGNALDEEAKQRGTSVYLVDRTIPMLPEILSNDLCSLLPNKDRLTMSAVFVIDKNAHIKKEWYGRTVIHSNKRFTYEEAEKAISKSEAPYHKELFILNNLAKKLTAKRFAKGAISLDQEEVKFILDHDGVPIKVIKKERGDSNKLIEEFMLLANRKVAETISKNIDKNKLKKAVSFIYRVHDLPSKEKTEELISFLHSLGYTVPTKDGIIPSGEINKLLKNITDKNTEDTIHRAVIRSMAKAVYSTKNIGHYGLAFPHYTHFTSPIRRYPDIVVHRLLLEHLSGKNLTKIHATEALIQYEKIALLSSEQEKQAADAERASIKYKQVEYMSKHVGREFDGIISGVAEWGIYIEEIETKCEGLVRVRDMKNDFYIFNEKKLELIGQQNKKRYRMGDKVKIKVKEVNLEKKTIDYILI